MKQLSKYTRLELMIYLVCWIIVFSMPLAFQFHNVLSGETSMIHWDALGSSMCVLLSIFTLFVVNNWVLLPRLFWGNHRVLYFVIIAVVLLALWYIQAPMHSNETPLPPHDPNPAIPKPLDMFRITNLVIELCVLFANFGIKLYIYAMRQDAERLASHNQYMRTELDSLRHQISPHFLMNTLNNIQSLIDIDPQRAYQTIQELSKMMRYMLYENNAPAVPLRKEVDFIHNYVSLMRIRYPEDVEIDINLPADDHDAQVPPMLFVSFIENAFKYGVSYAKPSCIKIDMTVDASHLTFECQNTINVKSTADKRGIGVENVKRRLQLIYHRDYQLDITNADDIYTVKMILPLQTPIS